jgi:hypothetical protein
MTRDSLVVAPLIEADAPPLLQQRGEALQRLRQSHVHLGHRNYRTSTNFLSFLSKFGNFDRITGRDFRIQEKMKIRIRIR